MEIRPEGDDMFYVDRQTDMTKLHSRFSRFSERALPQRSNIVFGNDLNFHLR
jgi:hypothetical protein